MSILEASFSLLLKLSTALTGFNAMELLGTGVAAEVFNTLDVVLPTGVLDELVAAAAPVSGSGPSLSAADLRVVTAILDDPKLGDVARSLIVLWYTGRWTALPDVWRAYRYHLHPCARWNDHALGGQNPSHAASRLRHAHPLWAGDPGLCFCHKDDRPMIAPAAPMISSCIIPANTQKTAFSDDCWNARVNKSSS